MRARGMMVVLSAGIGFGASCSDAQPGASNAPDASVDAEASARHDSGHVDGELDASDAADATAVEDPFAIGNWTPIPGIPSFCGDIRRADDPSLWTSKWIPCASGRAGCSNLDTSWSKTNALPVDVNSVDTQLFSFEPARLVDGKAYVLWRRGYFSPDRHQTAWVDVVEQAGGAAVLAIGEHPHLRPDGTPYDCPTRTVFGDYGLGFMLEAHEEGKNTDTQPYVTGWAPWSAPSPFVMRSLDIVKDFGMNADSAISFTTLGARGLWFGTSYPQTEGHYDLLDSTVVHAPSGTPPPAGALAIPGGAVVYDNQTPFAIAILKEDGSLVRLVTPTSPQFVTYRVLDRSTQPPTLVWVESELGGKFYTNSTLWTAPLVDKEADLVRRKVAKLNDAEGTGGGWGIANAGVFLSRVGKTTALLTRLSDGMGWLVQAEPGRGFLSPVWVDTDHLWIGTAYYDPQRDVMGEESGILRIDRSSLGAPTVSSGL